MGDQILVRNVPNKIRKWIDTNRLQYRITQQEFILNVLRRVSEGNQLVS